MIPPNATLTFDIEVLETHVGVEVSHILLKHCECSWPIDRFRNKKVTRTKAEAIAALLNIRESVTVKGQDWDAMAAAFSECVTQGETAGALGKAGPRALPGLLRHTSTLVTGTTEEEVLALEVGAVSEIVESDSGVHIVKRTK